jgi:hypothetical protein
MDPSLSAVEIPSSIDPSKSIPASDPSKQHYNDASAKHHHHLQEKINIQAPGLATPDRIPTSTWGPFTIMVIIFLALFTCFILNCSRIRRKVSERRMDKLGRSGPFAFERRHKELQEADLEWNNHPPMVFTNEKTLTAPESTYSSGSSGSSNGSGSGCSNHSSLSRWSSTNSTIAQKHHYHDKNFIKNQPPSVQLRLTLENASASNLPTAVEPARTSKRPMILPQHHHHQGQPFVTSTTSTSLASTSSSHTNNSKKQNYNSAMASSSSSHHQQS